MNVLASSLQSAVPAFCLAALLLTTGCAGFSPTVSEALAPFDAPVYVEGVSFYPQTDLHCGPAALATVLDHSGLVVDYPDLVERVYLPGRGGTLQAELAAAARSHNRIPWVLPHEPDAVLAEVVAGRPVLVLENQGLRRVPYWHYAVIIGFDPHSGEVIQHSGTQAALARPLRRWLRDWDLAGRWALLTLPPEQLPLNPDRERWLATLADFEAVAEAPATLTAWQAAAARWPDEPLVWLGQGNSHYRLDDADKAIAAFHQALALELDHLAVRFNLGWLLLERGDACQAVTILEPLLAHHGLRQRARSVLAAARDVCGD